MTPSRFPQANRIFQKPPSMTDEECSPLEVHVCLNQDAIISCWRPTWRERLAIFFGRPLWLWVTGTGLRHPPVLIEVQDPFAGEVWP